MSFYVFDPETGQSRKLVGGVEQAPDELVVSGTVGGSGAANQVAYWTDASTLDGDAGLTFDPATGRVAIAGSTFYKARLTVNFGGASDTFYYGIVVTGDLDGSATTQSGVLVAPVLTVDTSAFLSYLAFVELAANVDVSNTYGLWIYNTFLNTGATLDAQYGVFVLDLTSATNNYAWWSGLGEVHIGDTLELTGDLEHSGTNLGFFGATAVPQTAAYDITNVTTDRAYDADLVLITELADVVGTLIADLQAFGLLGTT